MSTLNNNNNITFVDSKSSQTTKTTVANFFIDYSIRIRSCCVHFTHGSIFFACTLCVSE